MTYHSKFNLNNIEEVNAKLGLTFDVERHIYEFNGGKCKLSATRVVNDFDFSAIKNLAYYQETGTTVHAVMEDMANVELGKLEAFEENDFLLRKIQKNAKKLFQQYRPLIAEQILVHPRLSLGGMIDLLCEKDGKLWIIDYKTSSMITDSHRRQLNLYRQILARIYDVHVEGLVLVKICKKSGEFKQTRVDIED
jgi:ATP-dependent exoDNAse (exonuclease V) beta subunit